MSKLVKILPLFPPTMARLDFYQCIYLVVNVLGVCGTVQIVRFIQIPLFTGQTLLRF